MDSYNVKLISYELTGEQDIVTYKKPIHAGKKKKDVEDVDELETKETGEASNPGLDKKRVMDDFDKQLHSIRSSLSRTIQAVYDYSRANVWEWFLTFTFNGEKVDRYDYEAVSKKLSKWLNNIKRKAPDLKYIIVPELHNDGAIHFHGMLSNTGDIKIVDSGKKIKGTKIYNFPEYDWGFTTASKVRSTLKASNYITKYITKELMQKTKGKKRYWNSKNLDEGKVKKMLFDYQGYNLINEIYKKEANRQKKVIVDCPDYQQEINYYTISLNKFNTPDTTTEDGTKFTF